MNERDSSAMQVMLQNRGFGVAVHPEEADLILFNTCTIRDKAYQKAMSDIGRARVHKHRPGVMIGICGCAAQQAKEQLLKRFHHIDFVMGPDQIFRLPMLLEEIEAGKRSSATDLIDDPGTYVFVDGITETDIHRGTAFVTIMKGCNYSCAYCIVPQVRGKEVNRDPSDILDEVKSLVCRGVKEVTLLGQNVADYKGLSASYRLSHLVRVLEEQTGIQRIRFTSPHPRDIDDTLIEAYAEVKSLCRHIHLPVQAGNNRVLKIMRRGYTREHYLQLIEKLRRCSPHLAITTDIIVGFPSETKEEFEETLQLVEAVQFDQIYAFSYSPRPGTFAQKNLSDDVLLSEKQERLSRLLEMQRRITREKNERCVGTTQDILVTHYDEESAHHCSGRSSDNRLVHFTGTAAMMGNIVNVRIVRALGNSLEGELYDNLQ